MSGRKYSSMSNKAERTKKCLCNDPKWSVDEVRVTINKDVVLTLSCWSCRAFWETKSREYRKYAAPDQLNLGSSKDKTWGKNYAEVFRNADEQKRKLLNIDIAFLEGEIETAQKSIVKLRKQLSALDSD